MSTVTVPQPPASATEISLRDHFAGQVLTGLAADPENNLTHPYQVNLIAQTCYRLADAMLVARKGGQ